MFEFVRVFMPAYIKYLPYLYLHGPQRKAGASVLKVMSKYYYKYNHIYKIIFGNTKSSWVRFASTLNGSLYQSHLYKAYQMDN